MLAGILTTGVAGLAVLITVFYTGYISPGSGLQGELVNGLAMSGFLAGAVYSGFEAARIIASPVRTTLEIEPAMRPPPPPDYFASAGVSACPGGAIATFALRF
jgi:hypothetical protein